MDEIEITELATPLRSGGIALRRRMMLGVGLGAGAALAGTWAGIGQARAQGGATPQASAPDAAATPDNGQAEIVVDHARNDPIPIALPSLGGGLGAQIMGVVTADLANCGLFKPVGGNGASPDAPEAPNFAAWKALGAQALVTGTAGEGSSARVEFRLWDVLAGQQLQGTAYSTSAGNWRRIAHIMADVIYERMLGEKGYFDTRVAYIAGTGPRDRRVKRLAIMDQDGANGRVLTDGQWLALTPRFHPTRDEVVFMSYQSNKPRVFLFDLGSGRQSVLGEFQGMSFAPRFAPDGGSVVMSVARDAGSDIVAVDLGSRRERRLTSSGSIDTSPCYSPDGSQIVFNSDRGGDQQLYVMEAGGGGARRISFGSGRYATPVWSPRGDLIAFTRLGGASWAIGVMKPDGSGERILSESYQVEGPTFCPNGRVIMFQRQSAASGSRGEGFSSHLVSIDITGFNERSVPTSTDATDPAWSPLNA